MTPEGLIIESLFNIPNKEGEDVPFMLNDAQRQIDDSLSGRDIIPKARQEGVSSYFLARFTAACMMYRNVRAVVISHDMESTQRLLSRVKYYVENIRGPKPVTSNLSANKIGFDKTNSVFYLGTAGSRKFGRGDTITHLHCSEYAFWPNAKQLMVGLLQAVPLSGEVGIESTGNGYNDYYRRCMRAYAGKSVWRNHFLGWDTFPEYQLKLDEEEKSVFLGTLDNEWEELSLLASGVSAEQLAWRRMKLDELDYDVRAFKQEYPRTLDECFQMSSESIFHKINYEATDKWKLKERGYWVLGEHPHTGLHYVTGSDVAAGVGKDASAVEVFCLETNEQVAEYVNDRIDPEAFASVVRDIATEFNKAYAVVENNNHGILTLSRLKDIYDPQLIHYDPSIQTSHEEKQLFGLGYRTTSKTKPLMIGRLRTLLAHEWTIHSPLLMNELSTYIEDEAGKLGAQDGCHDDTVMAAACCGVGLNPAALRIRPPDLGMSMGKDPFLMATIIEEMRGRGNQYPIRFQHGEAWNIKDLN